MNRLILLLVLPGSFAAFGQDVVHTGTVTLGAGGLPYAYNTALQKGGPAFAGNYEYRLTTHFALEAGTDILLPSGESFGCLAAISPGQNLITGTPSGMACIAPPSGQSRVVLLTYGLKGILPLAKNRVELFAGLGGAYAWNSEFSGRLNAALAQASLGGRVALDRNHRVWLGTTLRGLTDFGNGRQALVPLTFDFGIRF